jgi:ABC-type siderophore export system fused ATPase/permease subunit
MAIPRIVYFTAKRFASLIGFIAGGLAIGIGVVYLAYLSEQAFGSAIPAIAAIGLGMFVFLSYVFARHDVQDEQRKQERVLYELKKD